MSSFRKEFAFEYSQLYSPNPDQVQMIEQINGLMNQEAVDVSTLSHIVVLGASMDQTHNGNWILPGIVYSDHGFIVGGNSRALAAQQIVKENFTGTFLVTGGSQYDRCEDREVSRARVLAHAMVRKYGLPEEQVDVIGTNGKGNTQGNVENTKDYFINYGIPSGEKIGILSNEWHLPRSLVMFLSDPFFESNDIQLLPVIADDFVEKIHGGYKKWVNSFNSHPNMYKRHKSEFKGIFDLFSGNYKPLGS